MTIYLSSALLLLVCAFVVFRRVVRNDYMRKGSLSMVASGLELLVFAGLMGFPYLYSPPDWPWFWKLSSSSGFLLGITGFFLIVLGFALAFGTMGWFGLGRAFGRETAGLTREGPYRFTRNPQILGGYLLVIGVAVQRPSWAALGWVLLYAIVGHMMIITEEEHLRSKFGDAYASYCRQVPRYLRW